MRQSKFTMTLKFSALLCLVLLISPIHLNAQKKSALLPMPNSVAYKDGESFMFKNITSISIGSKDLNPSAEALQKIIENRLGKEIPVVTGKKSDITLTIDKALKGDEHYILDITDKKIAIKGATPKAVFRGVMTLDQLLMNDLGMNKDGAVTAVKIDDSPRFGYRALMLDPARNFLPVDDVKRFIDQMAKYKFNVLQLHLSDDQGWRLKLDKHPELSSPQAYSKDDIRDIVNYAADRYIDVVPELDIPGHTAAFLSVYPDLGCVHKKDEKIEVGTTVNRMLCAANPEVYSLFEDVIAEVASLFPYEYIHLGGDEAAIPENWAKCDSCLALMQQLGYDSPSQLMIPFFDKMLGFVRQNGKKPILWCELNNIYPPADKYLFPYPEDITLVTWRARLTPTCIELTGKSGFPLIMAPGEYTYFDYPQLKGDLPEFNNWGMPVTTLKQSYEFDPGYGLPAEDQAHITGVMGTLWGEAIKDINRVTYMAFPRSLALAEAGWTQMENRGWDSFKERMYPNLYDLMLNGVSFRVPFEIVEP